MTAKINGQSKLIRLSGEEGGLLNTSCLILCECSCLIAEALQKSECVKEAASTEISDTNQNVSIPSAVMPFQKHCLNMNGILFMCVLAICMSIKTCRNANIALHTSVSH